MNVFPFSPFALAIPSPLLPGTCCKDDRTYSSAKMSPHLGPQRHFVSFFLPAATSPRSLPPALTPFHPFFFFFFQYTILAVLLSRSGPGPWIPAGWAHLPFCLVWPEQHPLLLRCRQQDFFFGSPRGLVRGSTTTILFSPLLIGRDRRDVS